MINNHEDFCRALGGTYYPDDIARSERAVSHKVFQASTCGAWVKLKEAGREVVRHEEQAWSFVFRPDISSDLAELGVALGPAGQWPTERELPEEVALFLYPKGSMRWTWAGMMANLESCTNGIGRVFKRRGLIVFDATIRIGIREQTGPGVEVGSAVEGAETVPIPVVLRYPFEMSVFQRALRSINDAAEEIWHEANDRDTKEMG
jgi:hypothetical protein